MGEYVAASGHMARVLTSQATAVVAVLSSPMVRGPKVRATPRTPDAYGFAIMSGELSLHKSKDRTGDPED
jgi:hypothetical protein